MTSGARNQSSFLVVPSSRRIVRCPRDAPGWTRMNDVILVVFLFPGVLVLALVRCFDKSTRVRAGGLAVGNVAGLLTVVVTVLMLTPSS
jgi:hypothetical protein